MLSKGLDDVMAVPGALECLYQWASSDAVNCHATLTVVHLGTRRLSVVSCQAVQKV